MSAAAILDAPSVKGWPQAKLADVADIVNGGTPKSNVAEFWDGEHQWLTPADMGKMAGREIARTPRSITAAGLAKSSARLAPPSSVILSTRAPIGHLAINAVPMAFNQGCRALAPGPKLDHVFLYYFLLNSRELLNDLGTGTTFKELSASSLKTVQIPIPPLEEQKRIVAVLDQAFASVDRARTLAEANLADVSTLRGQYLDDQIAKLFAEFGSIKVNVIADVKGGKRLPKGQKTASEVTPYPYISVRDMTDEGTVDTASVQYISKANHNAIKRYTISSADIYVSIAGTIGKTGIVPTELDGANLTENAAKLVLRQGWNRDFIYWWTRSGSFSGQAIEQTRTAAQPKLALERLGAIELPRADSSSQLALVESMERMRGSVTAITETYKEKLSSIASLRQSLLQKAFAGELT